MIITRVTLKNWLPFRGEHTLMLTGKPYAIFAQHVDDKESSNWSGKTAFVEAIRFALDGWHRHDLDDEWITDGEVFGEVGLQFDTGETIKRTREKGQPSKLFYWTPGATNPMFKHEAQDAIFKRLKLAKEDFTATWFFAQRQMSRIILAKPDDRMKMLSAWFKLEPLERCEDRVRTRVNSIVDELQTVATKRTSARERMARALAGRSRMLLEADVRDAQKKIDDAKALLAKIEEDWQKNEQRRRAQEIREAYAELVEEGTTLAGAVNADDTLALGHALTNAEADQEMVIESAGGLQATVRKLEVVARGEFDGKCPIADIECPAKKTINESRATATAKLETERKGLAMASEELRNARAHTAKLRSDLEAAHARATKLDDLRARAEKILDEATAAADVPEPEDTTILRSKLAQARAAVEAAEQAARSHQHALATCNEVDAEEERLKVEGEGIEARLRCARAALVVVGKQGAQRKVAEDAILMIEAEANRRLAMAGIGLSVGVQWTRETQGLAKACDACGQAFPKSEKVKECTRCNATRGPQLQNKLDFLLSDQSGAAEDLAGVAVQLAARDWLLADRESDWEPIVLDEAFGALDAANRRALAQHLAQLIGGQQAFIIAHHAQVLDALPGRIEITRSGDRSTIRVAA